MPYNGRLFREFEQDELDAMSLDAVDPQPDDKDVKATFNKAIDATRDLALQLGGRVNVELGVSYADKDDEGYADARVTVLVHRVSPSTMAEREAIAEAQAPSEPSIEDPDAP